MSTIRNLFQTEPTVVIGAIGGVVDALLVLGVTFGLPVNTDQAHAIDGVVIAGGALLTLLAIRSQVTPTASVAALLPPPPPTPPTVTVVSPDP